jgi:hypothetical protein
MQDNTFVIGPIDEFKERDSKVREFLETAISTGCRIIHQRLETANSVRGILHDSAFAFDDNYKDLFNPIVKSIVITPYGVPLPEEKWVQLRNQYSTHPDLAKLTGKPKRVFFIGGVLERCIINAASYYNNNLRNNGEELIAIPEICVSIDAKEVESLRPSFDKIGLKFIEYKKALESIRT